MYNLSTSRLKLTKRKKCLLVATGLIAVSLCYVFGFLTRLFELNFDSKFEYPLNYKNFTDIVNLHKQGIVHKYIQPINPILFHFNIDNPSKCQRFLGNTPIRDEFEKIDILLVIKSATKNGHRRDAIRNSWGRYKHWSSSKMRMIFILGACESHSSHDCQSAINKESSEHGDIVQANFLDAYYNNTIKAQMSLKWVVDFCPETEFAMFVDDDYFLSPKNLIRSMRQFQSQINSGYRLYMGKSFTLTKPIRDHFSKWYISLAVYPYSEYPPFVNAGAYLLSKLALVDLYYGSMYTKYFKFDDIFLAFVAKKMSIDILNNSNFYNLRHGVPNDMGNVIAAHGFDNVNLTHYEKYF